MKAYKLFWDDFSGLYLEMVKPAYGTPSDAGDPSRRLSVSSTR